MLAGEDTHGGGAPGSWRHRITQLAVVLAGCSLLLFGVEVVRLALFKVYTIDEFQYAHASWAIASSVDGVRAGVELSKGPAESSSVRPLLRGVVPGVR